MSKTFTVVSMAPKPGGFPREHSWLQEHRRDRFIKCLMASTATQDLAVDLRGVLADGARGETRVDEVLLAVCDLRKPQLDWLIGTGGCPDSERPAITLILPHGNSRHRLQDWVQKRKCPSFFFSTGISIVDASISSASDDSKLWTGPDGAPGVVQQALSRSGNHPLVTMGKRADDLFGKGPRLDSTVHGWPTFRRAYGTHERKRELGIVVPGTYELEGGISSPIPHDVKIGVLRYVITELTGEDGRPSDNTGYTLLRGSGWWFSPRHGQHVEESVNLMLCHLQIHDDTVNSVARYLRFAWLQDYVFATIDGKAAGVG